MTPHPRPPGPVPPAPSADVAALPVLDPADLRLLNDLAARHGVPIRHVLLASLVCLLRRHAELGPATLSLDLSSSLPFTCPIPDDQATPFSHVVRAVVAAEAATFSTSPTAPRTFPDDVVPYRIRLTLPPGWRGTLAAPSSTVILSLHPDEGLLLAPADSQPPPDAVTLAPFRRLRPILHAASDSPDCPIARLPLLTPAERHQLLVDWNDTRSPLPPFACAHQLVEAQVARTPHATAVRFRDQSLTYHDLDANANCLARTLQSRGVGPDSLVGICLDRGPDMLVALLATLKAGAAYLPLDPHYPPDRLAFILRDSAAAVVISHRAIADRLDPRPRTLLCLDDDPVHLSTDLPATPPDCRATPDSLCYVIYTSGSTGNPKGVQVPHRAFVNFLASMATTPGLSDRDVLLAVTTLSFDIAALELFLPLTVGARVELLPRDVATDGIALRRAFESSGATILQATPATWRMLLNAGWQGAPGLRMLCGGEALPRDLARQLLPRGAELWNMYGPTETTVWSTLHRAAADDASPVPIGRPIANTRCYVLDPHLQPVPVGLAGELYIAGDGLARGYLNRPDLTAERFLPDPFSDRPGARLYRTGDVCRYRPDGQIEYLGRNDHQVKVNGFRIELGEVEDALLRLPGIRQACCTSRESAAGSGGAQLVAYVVPDPAASVDPAGWRRALRNTLPPHTIPAAVIPLARFPLTPSGKVDRSTLPSVPPLTAAARGPVPPRDDTESRLVDIWRDVLRLDRLGVTDDFFALGGDSLVAVNLAVRVEREFGRPIVVADLLPSPTIESLATLLRSPATDVQRPLVVPLQAGGARPPLFCLPGIGGHCFAFRELVPILGADQPFYGLNLPGTDGLQAPGHEVRPIASRLLDEIRAVQPDGPYYLAGYSFGGTIAYEMALQLRARHQAVAVVILLDAFGPGYPRTFSLPRRACRHASRLLLGPPEGRTRYVAHRLGWVAERFAGLTGRGRPPAGKSRIQDVLTSVAAGAARAERGYDYPRYDGHVALFRATVVPDLAGHAFDDPQNGWGAVVTTPITLVPVPSSHVDFLQPPQLRRWGHDLRDLLLRVQSA